MYSSIIIQENSEPIFSTITAVRASFETSKPCTSCKPSDYNEGHVFLTKCIHAHHHTSMGGRDDDSAVSLLSVSSMQYKN
jgi:hypothetical protein